MDVFARRASGRWAIGRRAALGGGRRSMGAEWQAAGGGRSADVGGGRQRAGWRVGGLQAIFILGILVNVRDNRMHCQAISLICSCSQQPLSEFECNETLLCSG